MTPDGVIGWERINFNERNDLIIKQKWQPTSILFGVNGSQGEGGEESQKDDEEDDVQYMDKNAIVSPLAVDEGLHLIMLQQILAIVSYLQMETAYAALPKSTV